MQDMKDMLKGRGIEGTSTAVSSQSNVNEIHQVYNPVTKDGVEIGVSGYDISGLDLQYTLFPGEGRFNEPNYVWGTLKVGWKSASNLKVHIHSINTGNNDYSEAILEVVNPQPSKNLYLAAFAGPFPEENWSRSACIQLIANESIKASSISVNLRSKIKSTKGIIPFEAIGVVKVSEGVLSGVSVTDRAYVHNSVPNARCQYNTFSGESQSNAISIRSRATNNRMEFSEVELRCNKARIDKYPLQTPCYSEISDNVEPHAQQSFDASSVSSSMSWVGESVVVYKTGMTHSTWNKYTGNKQGSSVADYNNPP